MPLPERREGWSLTKEEEEEICKRHKCTREKMNTSALEEILKREEEAYGVLKVQVKLPNLQETVTAV